MLTPNLVCTLHHASKSELLIHVFALYHFMYLESWGLGPIVWLLQDCMGLGCLEDLGVGWVNVEVAHQEVRCVRELAGPDDRSCNKVFIVCEGYCVVAG